MTHNAEQNYLNAVQDRLERMLQTIETRLSSYAREIQEQKSYLWESRAEMDHAEKVSTRQAINQSAMVGEATLERRDNLLKVQRSPYFGRIDFRPARAATAHPIYIGIRSFADDSTQEQIVHDWRAPVAGLFYDYETGAASYTAPEGEITGEIALKRQFRIRYRNIELLIDSSVNIVDDVLQEELARSADEGMRNIVATIQRHQNAVIRNDDAHILVIQGVAGSGKTSIALHRIAYLLYRYRDSLSSDDILILSPNRVFSDYIADVLPELGEEAVHQIGMESLADELLEGKYRFQGFLEQTTELLERGDAAMRERLTYKASDNFLDQLESYACELERSEFQPQDIRIGRYWVRSTELQRAYHKHTDKVTTERIHQVTREMEQRLGIEHNYDLRADERRYLREQIKGMVSRPTPRQAYQAFFTWLERPDLFRTAKRGRLEYVDVFPLIYLKMRIEGVPRHYRRIKHLLVDEMQDYTPVQYAVLARLFPCPKTILGDTNQAVNPYNSSSATAIQAILRQAVQVTLTKSYRSTYEIMQFAQHIQPDPNLEAMERYGEPPRTIRCRSHKDEMATITALIEDFQASEHNALAILAKTPKQARAIFRGLPETMTEVRLLDEASESFSTGIIVFTVPLSKGLEFDRVIIPQANAQNYHSAIDRRLLYVACTRAMHRLALTYRGEPSPFISNC
mgnify:CR=1 FL=1